MPQDSLFFRVLRRFNILWIALAGLIIIVVSGHQLWTNVYVRHAVLNEFIAPQMIRVHPVGATSLTVMPVTFSSVDSYYGPWNGAAYALVRSMPFPEFTQQVSRSSYTDYVPNQVVNLMMVDAKTGDGAWLFPTNNQVIGSRDAVYEGGAKPNATADTDSRSLIGIVMAVKATDNNGKAAAVTGLSIYVWTKGKIAASQLLSADAITSFGQSGPDRYMVLYQKSKETRLAAYSVPDFKPLSDKRMPDAPH